MLQGSGIETGSSASGIIRAPVRQREAVQRFDYGSGQEMIRVGEHCFLFTAADALNENSYDIWSPESCPAE